MISKIYTIMDKVAKQTGPVFQAVNDEVASRHFETMIHSTEWKNDFELLGIGEYDDVKASLRPYRKAKGIQVSEKTEESDNAETL